MNTEDVCLMVLEYAAKHQQFEVFHVLYKDMQQTPLPDVLLVPVVVYHIVSRGQTGRFELAASLLDQMYRHDQSCCSFRKFSRLLLGIKMKMLLEVLREDSDSAMAKFNKHIPRQGYAYNTEDKQGLTKMNTDASKFRKFYLPLILEPEDRGRYFTEEYEGEFGQDYMESLQKLTQSVLANIVAWLSPCRLEVLINKRNEVPAEAYPHMCPAFKTLLDHIRVREKLDEEALMQLLKLLHDKDHLPARAKEKMKSVVHDGTFVAGTSEDVDSPVENILTNTANLKLDFRTTVSESLAPIMYTHLLYERASHRQELIVKQDNSRGILRKLRNEQTLRNTKTIEAKKVAEKMIKHSRDTVKCNVISAEVYCVKKHSHERVKDTIADERRSVDKSNIDVDKNENHSEQKKAGDNESHSEQNKVGDKRKFCDDKNANHCQKRKLDNKNHQDHVDRNDIHGEEQEKDGDNREHGVNADQSRDHDIQMLTVSQEKEPRSLRDFHVLLERLPQEKDVKKTNTDEESPDLLQPEHFYGLETPDASDNISGQESDVQEERTQKLFHRKCGKKRLGKRTGVFTRTRNKCCSRRENFYTAGRYTDDRSDINSHHVTIKPQSNYTYYGKEKLVPKRRRFLSRKCKNIEGGNRFSRVEYNLRKLETNQRSELNISSQIKSKRHTNHRSKPVLCRSKSLSRQCKTVRTASDKRSDICVLERTQTKEKLEQMVLRKQGVPNNLDPDPMQSKSASDLDPNRFDRNRSAAVMAHDEDDQDLMDSSAESMIIECATNQQSKSSVAKATLWQKEYASFLELDRDKTDDTEGVDTRKKARFRSSTCSFVGEENESKGLRNRRLTPERMNDKCNMGKSKSLDVSEQSNIKLFFHNKDKENIFNKKWRIGVMQWKRKNKSMEQEDCVTENEVFPETQQMKATKGSNKDNSSHSCEKCDDTDTESDKYQSSKPHDGVEILSEDSEKLLCKVNHTKVTCAQDQDTSLKGKTVTKNTLETSDKIDPLFCLTHTQKQCQNLVRISEIQDKVEDSDKLSPNVDTPDDAFKSPAAATTVADLSLLFSVDQVPNPEGTNVDSLVKMKWYDSDVGVVVPPSVRSEDCSDVELDMLEDSLEFEDNKILETVPDIAKFLHT